MSKELVDALGELCVRIASRFAEQDRLIALQEETISALRDELEKAIEALQGMLEIPHHIMGAPGVCRDCGAQLPEIPGDHQTPAAGDDGRRWDPRGPCPGRRPEGV